MLAILSHWDRNNIDRRHFADDIFKCIYFDENVWISLKISLKFVLQVPSLVQIMAYRLALTRRQANRYRPEQMTVSLQTYIYTLPGLNELNNVVNWAWGNKFHWNLDQNTIIFVQVIETENVVCEMATILSRPNVSTIGATVPSRFPHSLYTYPRVIVMKSGIFRIYIAQLGPLLLWWIKLIPACISNNIHHKRWDEITYPFPIFKIEVWEWTSNPIHTLLITVTS